VSVSRERVSAAGYTRDSVDAYLRAASAERSRIQQAIAEARAQAELARRRAEWLDELTIRSNAIGFLTDDPGATSTRGSAESELPAADWLAGLAGFGRPDAESAPVPAGFPGLIADE
jgi:hypothetical protein